MTESEVKRIIEQLRNGEISNYYVPKENFMIFRKVLIEQEDYKKFRGIAQRGGDVIYEYIAD